ncbi:MAG: methylated-DNA--[protein]-cysteine S-methyltransferase [Desulfobacteraceae bacterium]
MAGKEAGVLYRWDIRLEKLIVYMVSSDLGAKAVKILLSPGRIEGRQWEKEFTGFTLLKGEEPNRPLMEAVLAVLEGGAPPRDLVLDIHPTPFQWGVWKTIQAIPFGSTATYGEVARGLGKPAAARAVGRAMAQNPLPLIFP